MKALPKKINPRMALAVAAGTEWFYRNFRGAVEPKVTVQALCALLYSRSLNIGAARKDLGFSPVGGTEAILRGLVKSSV